MSPLRFSPTDSAGRVAPLLARLANAERLVVFFGADGQDTDSLGLHRGFDRAKSRRTAASFVASARCARIGADARGIEAIRTAVRPAPFGGAIVARLGEVPNPFLAIVWLDPQEDPERAQRRVAAAAIVVATLYSSTPQALSPPIAREIRRPLILLDGEGRICGAGPELAALSGQPYASLFERALGDLFEPRCRPRFGRHLAALKPGAPSTSVYGLQRPGGERLPVLATLARAARDGDSSIVCQVHALAEDEAAREIVGRIATAIFPEPGTTIRADRLLAETADALDLRLIAVALPSESGGESRIELAAGPAVARLDLLESIAAPTPWDRVLAGSAKPVEIPDLAAAPGAAEQALGKLEFRAFAGLPMGAPDGSRLGVLFAMAGTARAFSAFELEALGYVAEFLATDLDRRRAERALERRAAELAALLEATRDLTQLREPDDLQRVVLRRAIDLVPAAQFGSLYFLEGDFLSPRFTEGDVEAGRLAALRIAPGRSVVGRVFETRRGISLRTSDEVLAAIDLPAESVALMQDAMGHGQSIRGMLAVALVAGDLPLGVLMLGQHGGTESFGPGDLPLLERFAGLAAAAIVQARLFEAVRVRSALVEAVQEAVFSLDADGTIALANEGARHLFGREEVLRGHGSLVRLFDPMDGPALEAALETTRLTGHWVGFLRGLRTDGLGFDAAVALSRAPGDGTVVGIVSDITERRQLEARALQSQTLDSLGKLAAGIAHDFNNHLGSVLGFTSLLRGRLASDSPLLGEVRGIEQVADQAAQLARRLLVLGRTAPGTREKIDLNPIASGVAELLRRTLDPSIEIELRLAPRACTLLGDETGIRQALLNLATNARDALPRGGRITFTTEALPNARVALTVSDNGVGMSPEVLRRLYEPFFTTKPVGKGTGLGSAIVFATVRAHGGTIDCDSAPERGTSFRLIFPGLEGEAALRIADARGPAPEEDLIRGTGTILLVEDDAVLRRVTSDMVSALGYEALSVAGGREAIEVARARGSSIDAVLLDLTMPGMSGPEVFQALRALDPSMRIVITSGYAPGDAAAELIGQGALELLSKPYRSAELSRALARATGMPRRAATREIV